METEIVVEGDDAAAGGFFLDVCRMIEAAAARSGGSIQVISDDGHRRSYFAAPELIPQMTEFGGRHRAQFVPQAMAAGRIVTAIVSVTVAGARVGSVVRTYNFPLQVATDHRSSEKFSIDDALSGHL